MLAPVYLHHQELPSTHGHAIDLLSKTTPQEGTVIVADYQTAGKGRYSRSWQSDSGTNILMSCVLYPRHLAPAEAFHLNVMSTLATRRLLQSFDIEDIDIKWPNDVLVGQKKIAGTLIQNQLTTQAISNSVVSIGINVNQAEWSDGVLGTSMKLETGTTFKVDETIKLYVDHLMSIYKEQQNPTQRKEIFAEWKNLLFGFQQRAIFSDHDGNEFSGTIVDVDELGSLRILMEGQEKTFHVDEIRLRKIDRKMI